MKLYKNKKVLLRDNFKISKIEKKLNNNRWLVSFYNENNKFIYKIINGEEDIIEESEYEIIKNRNNKINKILS